ncbi:MAG: HD domain-containing protein [Treponema sp.]|nr:HD domain-containing protein [Treponema sp.]
MDKIRQRLYVILEKEPKREDKVSRFFNLFLLFFIWINLTVVILGLIFDLHDNFLIIYNYFEIFSIALFTIEFLLRIWIDPYKPPSLVSKNVLLSKLPPYLCYIFSPLGLIDLLAILPFYLPLIFPIDLRILRVLRMFRLLRVLKLSRYDKTVKMLSKILDNVLQGLANIIEFRDKESGEHVKRTQLYVKALIDYLIDTESVYAGELRKLQPDIIIKSMALHDVGKIAIPDRILQKPARLEPDEYEIMKTHAVRGKEIINELGHGNTSIYLKHCEDICYCHHERWDGKGYPQQLKEEEIPLTARLAALADVYDALVCVRAYKPSMPYEEAVKIITDGRGCHFDPVIVDAFLEIKEQFMEITQKYR